MPLPQRPHVPRSVEVTVCLIWPGPGLQVVAPGYSDRTVFIEIALGLRQGTRAVKEHYIFSYGRY